MIFNTVTSTLAVLFVIQILVINAAAVFEVNEPSEEGRSAEVLDTTSNRDLKLRDLYLSQAFSVYADCIASSNCNEIKEQLVFTLLKKSIVFNELNKDLTRGESEQRPSVMSKRAFKGYKDFLTARL